VRAVESNIAAFANQDTEAPLSAALDALAMLDALAKVTEGLDDDG
jgi:hypothetical protein